MAIEIERKFLVVGVDWRAAASKGRRMRQGYLSAGPVQVRIRLVEQDEAWLTVKGERDGATRAEFEYAIPVEDAEAMLKLCLNEAIDKTRYEITRGEHIWEVDVYAGRHAGLVVAEIELDAEDEAFTPPAWIGEEVTSDGRYSNSSLAQSGVPRD